MPILATRNTAHMADDARTYADKNGMVWNQVFQPGQGQAPIVQAFNPSISSAWLIGPDGVVIAENLRGDAIKDAVAKALSK